MADSAHLSNSTSDHSTGLPAPVLRPFVTEYGGFSASGLTPGTHIGLPSRAIDLIISFGPPIDVIQMPNPAQRPATYQALVSGLQDAPAVIQQGGEAHGIHIFLTPPGVRAILGVSSKELVLSVVHLSDIWGKHTDKLRDHLISARTWKQRFAILDSTFIERLNSFTPPPEIQWAWQKMTQTHGCLSIEALAREIGWSKRHFGERFRETIGVTPKAAARVFRFERACRVIKEERPSLADVAAECGYYDQAHMNHEWRSLAGCSPNAWISNELPFLQDYELAGRDT